MKRNSEHAPIWQWIASAAACLAGVVVAALILRLGLSTHSPPPELEIRGLERLEELGTTATFTVGERTITQRLTEMNWTLEPGERIGSQPVNGPIEARFEITFIAQPVSRAYLGVEVRGGSVMMMRDGRVLASTYAGDETRRVMMNTPESFSASQQQVSLIFKSDAKSTMHVRALWKPLGADEPGTLPSGPAVVEPGHRDE